MRLLHAECDNWWLSWESIEDGVIWLQSGKDEPQAKKKIMAIAKTVRNEIETGRVGRGTGKRKEEEGEREERERKREKSKVE